MKCIICGKDYHEDNFYYTSIKNNTRSSYCIQCTHERKGISIFNYKVVSHSEQGSLLRAEFNGCVDIRGKIYTPKTITILKRDIAGYRFDKLSICTKQNNITIKDNYMIIKTNKRTRMYLDDNQI